LNGFFNPNLKIPSTREGYVDLDNIHVPIIKRVMGVYSRTVSGLGAFSHNYPTSGSSEGIREVLKEVQKKGADHINVFTGEYEGYAAYAKAYGMGVSEFDPETLRPEKVRPGTWFVSNPSAIDGNIIPNEFVTALCDAGHSVVLDLAYVGATRSHEFNVNHENVPAVVMSFSKPYGVFRHRIGGFTFSREPIDSLHGNMWFKDTLRLLQALKIAEEIGPGGLYGIYRPVQEEIIAKVNEQYDLPIRPSDSLLLGHVTREDALKLNDMQRDMLRDYRRGPGYRLCFTPYFEERERTRRQSSNRT